MDGWAVEGSRPLAPLSSSWAFPKRTGAWQPACPISPHYELLSGPGTLSNTRWAQQHSPTRFKQPGTGAPTGWAEDTLSARTPAAGPRRPAMWSLSWGPPASLRGTPLGSGPFPLLP